MSNDNEIDEVEELLGRKSSAPALVQADALKQAALNLMNSSALKNDNLGELYARAYAQEALHGLMQLARDATIDPKVRRQAYFDVYTIGYGKPASVIKVPGDLGPNMTIDHEISKAGESAQALNLLSQYANVSPENWPDELKRAAGLDTGDGD